MPRDPAVSVVIPTCNRPELLRTALDSLVWQSFKNFEAVVVNDGEADVAPVIADYAGVLDVTMARHESRMGLSAARNTGIRLSRGEYLVYLDDDDFLYREHLEYLYGAVTSTPYRVVYTDAVLATQERINGVYDAVSRHIPLSEDFTPAVLAFKNITPALCLIHDKRCLRRSLPFAPYLRGHEDWDLWQRMGRHYRFRHIPCPTAEFIRRTGEESLSAHKNDMAESWLFVRRQGLLHSALPPVYALEERAAKAVGIGAASGPVRVSVILPLGLAPAFTASSSALRALDVLCDNLGDAQLILAGAGEGMPELCQSLARRLRRPPRAACGQEDVGRVIAANQAAALAEGEWLVFVEPGVAPCPGWLDSLLEASRKRPSAGALGGIVESPRGGACAGGTFSARGEPLFNRSAGSGGGDCVSADCLSSLCLMVRREHFFAADGFHPAFAPGHYADADLCLRLRRRGLDCVVAPDARLLWNRENSPLRQSPAGLVSRRTFWDSWVEAPFSLSRFVSGAEWSMRPEDLAGLWPSDGIMPESFDRPLPPHLQ